ncbi:MAG: trimeric intracellular cation channel family protein [Verrucomicrobiales bacterium]
MEEELLIRTVNLPPVIDLGATFVFSITGAMEAIRRHYDPVGLFVLALASGLGGGLLRDGLFIQAGPPAAMRDASYMLAVLAGCVVAGIFFKHVARLSKPFLLLDALGTGAYGVVGASRAFEAGLAIPACIFVGVVNAVGSGLIRDVLVREEPLLLKPGQFYVVASLAGISAFAALARWFHVPLTAAAISAITITFGLRLLAIWFDWKTRPVLQPPSVS